MSRNPWGSEPHRFVVEDLLDHPVVGSPNNHAPAPAKEAGGSIPPELGPEEAEKEAEVA